MSIVVTKNMNFWEILMIYQNKLYVVNVM